MSFSFLGGLASLLPGYIQGQRMANQDNWQDLMNYNQVQSGQLANAFTEGTWQDRLNMFHNERANSDYNRLGNLQDYILKTWSFPGNVASVLNQTMWAPQISAMQQMANAQMWQQAMSNPWGAMAAQGDNGRLPAGLGG